MNCSRGHASLAVSYLSWRMRHRAGRNRFERTGDSTVEGQLGTALSIDHDPGRVWGVFDTETSLKLHRYVTETSPLDPQEADLVVVLPGNVARDAPAAKVGTLF